MTLAILTTFLLVSGTVTYVYSSNNEGFDRFFPKAMRDRREWKRIRLQFPDTIENFVLFDRSSEKIQMRAEECSNIEDHPDTARLGLSGEICRKTVIAQYREQAGDHVIFVQALIVTKGSEIQRAYLSKVTQPMMIGTAHAFRLERHEIGWYPTTRFDVLLTQEGRWKSVSGGGESMSYRNLATGDNPVTQYFLSKFSPAS